LTFAVVAAMAVIVLGVFVAGAIYELWGEWKDKRRFPPPGRMVVIDGSLFHVCARGPGSPPIVFEAGIAASSLSWRPIEQILAASHQVVTYDRSGFGWSERSDETRTLEQMVHELDFVLKGESLNAPYVLVGHSFGGLLIRAFTHTWPAKVVALVFVDPVSIENWSACSDNEKRRLLFGAKLSRRGAWLARFGVVRFALAMTSAFGGRLTAGITRASAQQATSFLTRLVGEIQKLPSEVLPIVRAHWSTPRGFLSMAEHLEALPFCAAAAKDFSIPNDIPFVVLSAATATEQELHERDSWVQASNCGEHLKIERSGHWLQLDRPDAVIDAVERVISKAKQASQRS
jgi:pimeloyl-ACP methyl ester carboxylesterase